MKKVMSRWHQHGEPSAVAIRRSATIDRAAFDLDAVLRPHLGPARMLRQYMTAWSWLQQSNIGSRRPHRANGSKTRGGATALHHVAQGAEEAEDEQGREQVVTLLVSKGVRMRYGTKQD
jgi:hypothetical protein